MRLPVLRCNERKSGLVVAAQNVHDLVGDHCFDGDSAGEQFGGSDG